MADENIELVSNLENLLSPFCYVPEVPLPKTVPEVPGGMYLSGFISQDCTWGCCFNHSVLKCFPVDRFFEDSHISFTTLTNNGTIAVSSSSYTFPGGHITCATELAIHNPRIQSGMRKLLLGISYTGDNNNRDLKGAVVIFDPIRCAPMKWIEIPDPVSSITVLSHFEEGGSNRPFFNETMMAMVGIAAVGLRGGSVLIIDLGLDDPNLSLGPSDSRNASNLTYRLLYVNPHEYVIATKRHKAVSKRNLIALRFSNEPEDEMIADAFHYCKPTGESLLVFNKTAIAVTCLEYVPAIGSLLVGFTCGGFQIWRINNMELQFSSEPVHMHRDEPLHVFGFSFQQPVDDPKNYCYIWVMYGNKSAECGNVHVELHSLYYERKNFIENFGFVYDGFKQCAKRLGFPLIDDFLSTDSENEDYDGVRCSARPIRIWTQPDSELMYCSWEVGRGGVFYLGIFDLNQWYSNHTKEQIYFDQVSGLCPYWVALPVEIPDVSNFVMDVRLLPKSLMRWENPHSKLDIHLYPASLSFRAMCLTNTGVSAFEHFGVQEKLIRKILRDGPSLMIEPKSIKRSFVRNGLEPVFPIEYGDDLTEKDQDRFFVLTVLLENRRTTPIIYLANAWLDGSYANVGCTIDLMIDWIAAYTVALRTGADEHWDALFHFPESILPPETVRYINFSNFAWTSLHRLLLTIMGPSEVYSVRRQKLENMEFGLGKLVQYSSALLMMYKAQLLPACDRSFITRLSEYYERRRLEAKEALENCVYIDNQFKKSHPLMIDHLMDSLMIDIDIHSEWHVDDGHYCYPPRHVGYLVNMFMWLDADPKAVSRVFMYFLIDLSLFPQSVDATHNSSIIEKKVRGDFKAVMEGSAEEYQEIMALWLLDHGFQSEILILMKENDRLYQKDGLPWCAAAVALTATGFENDVAELLLKSCPHNLAKLLFNLMTSSISKYTSLAELMVSSNLSGNEELLQEFFEISEERERLAEFIRTKAKELPDRVKTALLAFLNNGNSVKRLSQLLMYYVHIEDYKKLQSEFTRVREILRHRTLSEIDRKMWRFQETYINHLLNTTKASMVQQFLRLQSPQSVRPVQSTISIRAVQADNDESKLDVTPERARIEPKLPPHLRRLKLSESVAHDPLSPLRRYAGKIQSAVSGSVTAFDSEREIEDGHQRPLQVRKSYSRRISVSPHSFINSTRTMLNESCSNDDRLNVTSRNAQVDLISLLKTPSVDHRAEERLKNSFLSFNQIMCNKAIEEADVSQLDPPQPHSIMKEVDPTKPKTTKKVELRFENLSLSSEEGDENNVTIYEDADENLEEDQIQGSAPFDASFNSASDRSMFENQSVGEAGAGDPSVPLTDDQDRHGEGEGLQSQGIEDTTQNEPIAFHRTTDLMDIIEEDEEQEVSEPQSIHLPLEGNQASSNVVEGEVIHLAAPAPNVQSEEISVEPEEASSQQTRSTRSTTPNREIVLENAELTEMETKSTKRRSTKRTRSKSSTSTQETDKPEDAEKKSSPKRTRRSSRSMTPTRDVLGDVTLTEPQTQPPVRRSTRSTRSRTPTRDSEVQSVSENSPEKQTRRLTRSSRTPVRDVHLEDSDSSTVSSNKAGISALDKSQHETTVPAAASSHLSFEITQENMLQEGADEDEVPVPATSKKNYRGKVSQHEPVTLHRASEVMDIIEEREEHEQEADGSQNICLQLQENQTSRKVVEEQVAQSAPPVPSVQSEEQQVDPEEASFQRETRSRTRSTTPHREVAVDDAELKELDNKSPKRRSTKRTRSKSKTPTREVVQSEEAEKKSPSKRTRRSTRSMTPTRDALGDVTLTEPQTQPPVRRSTRSTRSRTPTRDSEVRSVSENSPEKQTRRLTRSSRTPVRDVYLEDSDSSTISSNKASISALDKSQHETTVPAAASSSFSFEITQEDMRQEDDEEDEIPVPTTSRKINQGKVSRERKRRLKYLHHQQDLSTVIEDSGTDASGVSVLEATLMPPVPTKPDPPKNKKIKGIKARPAEEETEPEINPVKPTKRRKAAASMIEFDDEDDDDDDVKSHVSTRSTRSGSSIRSVGKPKTTRRKPRSSKRSTT